MSYFIAHGPLPPASPLFRGRQHELHQLARLCRGEKEAYAILYGSRQVGKTSLLLRLQSTLPEAIKACRVDFQSIPDVKKPAQAFTYLARRLWEDLCPGERPPSILDAAALTDALCRLLEGAPFQRLVLMLEELYTLPHATRLALANLLRALFNSRYQPATCSLARLTVILAGGIELYDLAAVEVSPLNNICDAYYVGDLDQMDGPTLVAEGMVDLGVPIELANWLGREVYEWTSGHPSLTQRMAVLMEDRFEQGERPHEGYLEWAAQELLTKDDVLAHILRGVREYKLLSAARELKTDEVRFSRLEEDMARLELLGLAVERNGRWAVRNRLLSQALEQLLNGRRAVGGM